MQEYAVLLEENENLQRQFQVIFWLIKLYIEYILLITMITLWRGTHVGMLKKLSCFFFADSPGHSFPATQHIHLLPKNLEVE